MTTAWQTVRAKHLFEETDKRGYPSEPLLAATQDRGVVLRSDLDYRVWNPAETTASYKLVEPGDFVISLRSFEGGIELVHDRGVVSPAYITLRSKTAATGYFRWLFKSEPFIADLASRSTGIRQGKSIRADQFLPMALFVPPTEERVRIADFLDTETARIDALIEAKRSLATLVAEKQTVDVRNVVLRGLQPGVELKDSGIEWMNEIPAHWERRKVAHIVVDANAGEVIDKSYWGPGQEILFTCAVDPVASDFSGFPQGKRSDGADLLLTRNGTPYVHVPPAGAIYTNVVQRIRLDPIVDRQFAALAIRVAAANLRGYGVSIESLNFQMWKALFIALPPMEEQVAIARHVEKADVFYSDVASSLNRQTSLLSEYRQSLITAAVTGLLDEATLSGTLPADDALGMEVSA